MKRLCGLTKTENTLDVDFAEFLADASALVDSQISPHDTVPLDPAPDAINVIANYYAAGLYLQRNMAEGKKHPHIEFAESKLKEYIQTAYVSQLDLPIVIGKDEVES